MGKPPCDISPDRALSELLSKSSAYFERADIVEYDYDKVSLPVGAKPVSLEPNIKADHRSFLDESSLAMFRDVGDAAKQLSSAKFSRPYCDPKLFKSSRSYLQFLAKLYSLGMVRFVQAKGRKGNMGIFFVRKKDGSLRLIFDTRKLNCKFRTPPCVSSHASGLCWGGNSARGGYFHRYWGYFKCFLQARGA